MLMYDRLKAARKELKYSQEDVASLLGIDRSTYAYYELGKSNPTLDNLVKLAGILKVDIEWLIGADKSAKKARGSESAFAAMKYVRDKKLTDLSGDERRLVGFYRMIKACGREAEFNEAIRKLTEGAGE